MRATARVVAEADGRGGTRLSTLAGQAPLLLRRTGARDGAPASVHLVGGAAGPLGGDELACSVDVRAGAVLRMDSAAASVALPGPAGGESRLDVAARIDAGGVLHWAPQPLIAARGARHRATARVELAAAARLLWREEFVLGRFGEPADRSPPGSGSCAAGVRCWTTRWPWGRSIRDRSGRRSSGGAGPSAAS